MSSAIDASQPADGVPASKRTLRRNFATAQRELEHMGFAGPGRTGRDEVETLVRLCETLIGRLEDAERRIAALEAARDASGPAQS
ncbi:hypothetical protein [Marinivivus vitaminiproducens]|uniref:hypothetical protein n=1 Tax=Marinivivus vitaminiproducens TaxID=3035935 RepID=UPI00279F786C|nr:hypothetical protein P4R82_09715 [Geminicoccaceae bacterium SCSIO 64248]